MPRSPICRTAACCTTSGSRAAASASPRQRPRTPASCCATGASSERRAASNEAAIASRAASETAGFRFELELATTQPVLLQGTDGLSRKGPEPAQFSRYYSQPQLQVNGLLALGGGAPVAVTGRAWLDHEWSDALLAPEAVGWDWIGMNLDDGGALTAFRLRRRDGTRALGGRQPSARRRRGAQLRTDARWCSPPADAGPARRRRRAYPVEWTVTTPVGVYAVEALQDDQELDSRASTGSIYWEGLSRLARRAPAATSAAATSR